MLLPTILLSLGSAATGALAANSWIVPGTAWLSTSNTKIDAHGGNVVKRGDTFYWVGQAASHNEQPYMYTSTDLLNWAPASNPQNAIEYMWRPKIAKPNGSFWIYGQVDRLVQPLVSATMVGGYAVHGAGQHLPPSSLTYSDTGMFQDDDGTWYLLTSADHNIVQVNRLNSDGGIGDRVSQLAAGAYEAPGIFKAGGVYFLIVSGKTGWRSNPNKVFTATSINGPWTGGSNIAPEAQNTYNSQNTFELTIKGSQATTYIYMGDSWDSKGGPDSNYVWLPMKVDTSAKTVTLEYHAQWKVDPNTGVVSTPSLKKRYPATSAALRGGAAVHASKRAVHRVLDGVGEVEFRNVTGRGGPQWVQFHYRVPESNGEGSSAAEAHVRVNGQEQPVELSSLNTRAGKSEVVPVELELEEGDGNVITFGARGGSGEGVVIEAIEVVED